MENATASMFEPPGGANHVVEQPEMDFTVLALAGFAAQLVDGGLGMGYGLTPGFASALKAKCQLAVVEWLRWPSPSRVSTRTREPHPIRQIRPPPHA